MIQCANLMLGLDEAAGLAERRGVAVSVTAAEGFVAAGCHAGIKRRRHDMAMVATDDRKPVDRRRASSPRTSSPRRRSILDRARLAANGGKASAIIVNSGNANAGTGAAGLADAEAMAAAAANALGVDKARGSGLLDRDHRHAAADGRDPQGDAEAGEEAVARRRRGCGARHPHHRHDAPRRRVVKGSTFTLGGMAKGCGMIAPNMATMLAFLTTDAESAARQAPADPARCRRPDVQHAQCRRRDLDQRHRDPARQRPARQGRPGRVRRRGPQACARTSPSRWRRTPRA